MSTSSRASVVRRVAKRIVLAAAAVSVAGVAQSQEPAYVDQDHVVRGDLWPVESCWAADVESGCTVLEIGDAVGSAGDAVEIAVTLTSAVPIAGVELDMILPDELSIAPASCQVAPDLNKELYTNGFEDWVRALVLSLSNIDPVPEGTLFTCTVEIANDAAPGRYPIKCLYAEAADATRLLAVPRGLFQCVDGAVVVPDPLPTPTAIPPSSQDERALVADNSVGGGCQIDSAARGPAALLVLLPAALVLRRRRHA